MTLQNPGFQVTRIDRVARQREKMSLGIRDFV